MTNSLQNVCYRFGLAASLAATLALSACMPSESSDQNSQGNEKIEVATRMVQAWNDRDWEEVYALFSEDGVLHSMMMDPIVGRENIRARLGYLAEGIDQIELKIINMGLVGDVVMLERVDDFVYNGKPGAVPVVGVMEIADGHVTVWREYYDHESLASALVPDPPSAEELAAANRQAILDLTAKLQTDWNGGDMSAYLDAYWKDAEMSLMFGDGGVRGWQALSDLFSSSWTTEEAMGDFEVMDVEVRQITPDVAIASGSFVHRFPAETIEGAFSHVWRQSDDGAWLITHEHTSRAH